MSVIIQLRAGLMLFRDPFQAALYDGGLVQQNVIGHGKAS